MINLSGPVDGAFNPEIIRIMGGALDNAWLRLRAGASLNGSADAARTVLAKHIIDMTKQGERDPQRLTQGALARLTL
jgi:hypothetical protein